ncbi:DUF4007 family protein [Halieaceae bacterium IMCC8485]|uniref:DUF4007 family protein n=1 Tax=Candidatus Seongchinamella marina TaxID=2518990 RepID=A0ABT3T2G6_9GAMM|nr:DUF4007 family protein [Candidatus Seongchinamella marina]MCX2975719.1 DUF4007 family protein [Candidatus Seongchinamella marina]
MKARFTGHETFPLRYGWLQKAVNQLNNKGNLSISSDESVREAVIELGVGKNMVSAIRYWAEASAVIDLEAQAVTEEGNYLFGKKGKDRYLEHLGSVWLLHFWLNFNYKNLTAYRYYFNFSNARHFQKAKLVDDCIEQAGAICTGKIPNETTVKKDIDCFLNTYCHKQTVAKKKGAINEDHFSSPLSELNLVEDTGGGYYICDLVERSDLPIEVFMYGLLRFVAVETEQSDSTTMGFDSLLTKPYSPGRIFQLSEGGLGQKLDQAQLYKESGISWTDSEGLRQIAFDKNSLANPKHFLDIYYKGA